jgi:hypothetical protein
VRDEKCRADPLEILDLPLMAVGEVRPGYELWRPNREKPQSVTTKFVVVLLLLASAGLALIVTIGGWSLLEGGAGMGLVCVFWVILYVVFAYYVARWNRGVLPVAAAFAVLLLIFAAVAAPSWFARDKSGFEDASLPVPLLGTFLILLIPLQILLIAVAMFAFNQEWHVEEERPIGSGEDYGAGSGPEPDEPEAQPA